MWALLWTTTLPKDQGGDLGGDQGGFWWPTQWANSFQKPGRASGAWGPGGGSQAWLSKQRGGEAPSLKFSTGGRGRILRFSMGGTGRMFRS